MKIRVVKTGSRTKPVPGCPFLVDADGVQSKRS